MTNFLKDKINTRIQSDSLRELKPPPQLIDFSSNDYLGFAKSMTLKGRMDDILKRHPSYPIGSTGSRLLSGNSEFAEDLEKQIADFHHAEAGLIFNSGYDANIGLLSSIPQRKDTIICDELIHASLIDGARLSHANRYIFKHNDIKSLEEKLKNSSGNVFIVTESIFSMDGDSAPLNEINELAKHYKAHLLVDEAHATGLVGEYGKGLVNELHLEKEVFARVHTFGKALGVHGAVVLGSIELKTFLVNFARSFIYTTALPFHSLAGIKAAYEMLPETDQIKQIKQRIRLFKDSSNRFEELMVASDSAIQCIIIKGNQRCKAIANGLQEKGFDVRPILSPTVAEGKERLRICIHSYNTPEEIRNLVETLNQIL